MPAGGEGLRYRLGVAARALAALFGGYAVAALAGAALALCLPGPRSETALAGALASFAVYAAAAMWCFAVRSAARAWGGLLLAAAALGLLVWVRYAALGAAAGATGGAA
ncbi:MAG: DUF3649 domain-containing protein [Xylophilus ampelinus]